MENIIVDVWKDNLDEEMKKIRRSLSRYPYISMDTEFPGVVAKPIGTFSSQSSFNYQQLRCNVDLLKIIQLGITLSDNEGNCPRPCTWQFNFEYDINSDMYSQESIELLIKAKIDFDKHKTDGIRIEEFGDLLITSGLILNEEIFWISFHSSYDFGYLIKLLTGNPLPERENDFYIFLNMIFVNLCDIKFMMKGSKHMKKGLQEIADDLCIKRVGVQHQAGSDSFLTCLTYFKVKEVMFQNFIDTEKYMNKLYGIEPKTN